jgi:hypothetical protein
VFAVANCLAMARLGNSGVQRGWMMISFLFSLNLLTCQSLIPRPPTVSPTLAPTSEPCAGPLECTIADILIGPFDFCIEIPTNTSEVYGICVWDFFCNGIKLDSIESNYVPPHSLALGFTDVGLSCYGNWNVTSNSSSSDYKLLYSGAFSAAISDLTAETLMELENYLPSGLPNNFSFYNCSVDSVAYEIHFLGGTIGKSLDKNLAPKLEDALTEHTDELLCGLIGTLLDEVITSLIHKMNIPFEIFIESGQNPPPPPVIAGAYDWKNSKIQTIHNLLNLISIDSETGPLLSCFANFTSDVFPIDDLNPDINQLIDLLTRGTGKITVPLNTTLFFGVNDTSSLMIESIVISGLDTFSNISLFVPSNASAAVLSSSLALASLGIELNLLLNASSGGYVEELIVKLELSNVLLDLDLVIAVSVEAMNSLYLDQYLGMNATACMRQALEELYISSLGLYVSVDDISLMQVTGGDATSLEQDVVDLVNNFFEWILGSYPVSEIIAGIAQDSIKAVINSNLQATLDELTSGICPVHVDHTTVDYVYWNTSEKINTIDMILNTVIGPQGLNNLMTCITNGTGELTIHLASDGAMSTTSSETGWSITLFGLDSFYQFALVYPLLGQPYNLGNQIGVGYCDTNSCKPFGLTVTGLLGPKPVYLSVEMENLSLFVNLFFMIDKNGVLDLTVAQSQTQGCVMTAADELSLYSVLMSISSAELFLQNGNVTLNLTDAVDYLIDQVVGHGGIVTQVNDNFEETLATADDKCAGEYVPGGEDDDANSNSNESKPWTWQIAIVMSGCLLSLIFLVYIYHAYGTQTEEEEKLEARISAMTNEDRVHFAETMNQRRAQKNHIAIFGAWICTKLGYPNVTYDALVTNMDIPLFVRILFPFAVLANMAVFLMANVRVGTSVMVEIDIGSITIDPPSIFDFTLANTVTDMWEAGVYPLSILIAFFSGAWPYIKLAGMFGSWFTPSSVVSVKRREWCLEWLDILGKWSLLDAYVMVMMMVAFHVELIIAPGLTVTVIVIPKVGFNLFLLATMISLGLGHIAIACHRLTTEGKFKAKNTTKESVGTHVFKWRTWDPTAVAPVSAPASIDDVNIANSPNSKSHSTAAPGKLIFQKFQFTQFGFFLVALLIVCSILVVIAGAFMYTFEFHFKGLTGYLLKSDADTAYSLVKTGTSVATSTGHPDNFYVRWIQAAFFGFGVAMPLGFLFLILIVWTIPLNLDLFRQLVVLAEVANAWNAIDVFVVSVVAALLELHQFAAFIVGDSCDDINKILKEYFDDELNGDDTCFDVTATLKTVTSTLSLLSHPTLSLSHTLPSSIGLLDSYSRGRAHDLWGPSHDLSLSSNYS